MQFKLIELSDKQRIDSCFQNNIYKACDFSFANLFAWRNEFETSFVIEESTIFIKSRDYIGNYTYMMPIGPLSTSNALIKIMDDARNHNVAFKMWGVSLKMWQNIECLFPDKFIYVVNRNYFEYIYLSERLINLSGKKLQPKRNHINRFKIENPDWKYMPITTKQDLDACSQILDEWVSLKENEGIENHADYESAKCMLHYFHDLSLKGGMIKVADKVIAFSLGEVLADDTFVVHIEKALPYIHGAYPMINQQFVIHEAAGFKYINREEDMGLDNIRKAKLSYQPEFLLEEGILTYRQDVL